jgi:hypothetical protein
MLAGILMGGGALVTGTSAAIASEAMASMRRFTGTPLASSRARGAAGQNE